MITTTTTTLPNGLSGECAVIESTDEEIFVDIPLDDSVIIGEEYVFTIYVNPTKQIAIELISGTENGVGSFVQNGWKRIEFPVLLTEKTLTLKFEPSKVYLYEAQLESGSVVSSWKESEADINENVDKKLLNYATTEVLATKIEESERNILLSASRTYSTIAELQNVDDKLTSTTSRVTTAEAQILLQADQISSKVSKDGVISAINQTAESVTIDASKINLNGVVTANDYFKINTDGSMEATAGKFGCLTISGNYVQADSATSGTGYRMYIQKPTSSDTWCFSTQYGNINSGEGLTGKFYVTAGGYVRANSLRVAEDANIYGNVSIAGYASVTGDTFVTGNASVTGYASVTGNAFVTGDTFVTGVLTAGGRNYYTDSKFTCNGKTYIDGILTVNSSIGCTGTMEVSVSGGASNVILHNNYDRKAYIRLDEYQYLWLLPHTTSGFDSANGAYLNLETGVFSVASLTNRSSRRYKENIENITDDIADRLLDIQIVHFDYKSEYGDKDMYGVIAEDVLSIHPNAVSFGHDGLPEGVDYTRFIPLIIRKLQMQEDRINNLNDIVTHLIGISMSGSL